MTVPVLQVFNGNTLPDERLSFGVFAQPEYSRPMPVGCGT